MKPCTDERAQGQGSNATAHAPYTCSTPGWPDRDTGNHFFSKIINKNTIFFLFF
uniref:Uncharacterized protein n=1 Tax=Anguilla anguilla TaxID=7936 RepID=A0A0E9T3K2_ANGAN